MLIYYETLQKNIVNLCRNDIISILSMLFKGQMAAGGLAPGRAWVMPDSKLPEKDLIL